MSPGGYFAIAAIFTFAALICLRTHRDLPALIIIAATWTTIPILVLTDRLSFDGAFLSRSGLTALAHRFFERSAAAIAIADIERVEVTSLRTVRRGGNVRYRYRVEIVSHNSVLSFASGRQFLRMIQALLPNIPEHKLDARACELR